MFEKILLSQGKGDIFNSRGISNICFAVGGQGMNDEERKRTIIKMIQEIKTVSFLKMIYTVVKTCYEKEKPRE